MGFKRFLQTCIQTCFWRGRHNNLQQLRCVAKFGRELKGNNLVSSYLLPSILSSVFLVKAISEKNKTGKSQKVIQEADVLYDQSEYEGLYNFLAPHAGSDEPEILWRLARALFEKCRDFDPDKKLNALEEALGIVDRALKIDDNCWAAHKWRAILLDYVWRYKGTKGRIIHSFEVRKHMERAIELNPKDSTNYYLLGEWCYAFADLPWYQRKVASAIFASPPTSSYEEALTYFEKAEDNQPLFYSMNLLMMAKCLLNLQQKDKAVAFLKRAKDYPIKTPDDKKAHAEAEKLLKELNVE